MFKNLSILFCLLGVSLASGLSGLKSAELSKVEKMLEAVKKHQEYFGVCEEVLGEDVKNLKSCSALAEDIAAMEGDLSSDVLVGEGLYERGVELMAKFTTCGTENIFKQISCYEGVVTSAKSLISEAEDDILDLESQLQADVSQIETDLKNCFGSGYSSELLNAKMSLCKLRLMLKN